MTKEFPANWVFEQYKNTAFGFEIKEVLYSKKSKYQLVEILETKDWGRVLMLDGLMMVTEKDEFFYHETITHLPMALKEGKVKKVLVIGAGDGGTVRELTKYSQIEKIDIPRPDRDTGLSSPQVGKVFVKFKYIIPAKKVRHALAGRTYNKRIIFVSFYPEEKFEMKDYLVNY